MSDYQHAPGSDQAIADGCTCPVLDNAHGKGCGYVSQDGDPLFIVSHACPIHWSAETFEESTLFALDLSGPAYGAASRLGEKIA